MTLRLSCVLLAAGTAGAPPLKEHLFALSNASPRGEIHDCWAQRERDAYPPSSEALRSCCLMSDADRRRTNEELKVRPLHFPRSYVELAWHLVNRTARDLDFNFVGRIDARPVKAARQFVPGFAKRHFTARSYYAESRPTRGDAYTPLGPWDRTRDKALSERMVPSQHLQGHDADPCLIAAYDADYLRILARSKFTLAPRGDQPWSIRFYEAILCGSIPIVKGGRGRNAAERRLGYKYYDVTKTDTFAYREDWARSNIDVFLRHQTHLVGAVTPFAPPATEEWRRHSWDPNGVSARPPPGALVVVVDGLLADAADRVANHAADVDTKLGRHWPVTVVVRNNPCQNQNRFLVLLKVTRAPDCFLHR